MADILYGLSVLNKAFQYKYVDVRIFGALVKAEITSIRMLFITESIDLDASTFNEKIVYHIILDFGPHVGCLKRLSFEIRGAKYQDILMTRDRTGVDLEEAITFQVCFAEKIYKRLENRFKYNDIVSCFKILNPVELPFRHVGMGSWGVLELERLCNHFGKDLQIDEKKIVL